MSTLTSPASEDAFVAQQFDDIEQQREAAKLGMWIFLATDVLLGGSNTAVLLVSSLLMAFAVRAAKLDQRRMLTWLLIGTALLGCVFMSIKGVEYHKDYVDHLVPGRHFDWHGADPRSAELFFWIYFAMTGLHAIHVTVAIGVMLVLALLTWFGKFSHGNYNTIEIAGF